MISLIIFLSTTVFFSISLLVLVLPLVVFRETFFLKNKITFNKNELTGYLILFLSSIFIIFFNIFLGPVIGNIKEGSVLGDIPYILLIPFAFLIGKFLNQKDLRILKYIIIIEIVVGVFEYISGVPTFFKNNTPITELADSDILYQKRVFGFSPNSSTLAAKIIYLSVIVMMEVKKFNKISSENFVFIFFILIGLFVTFNRTAIISIFLSLLILFGMKWRSLILLTTPAILIVFIKWDTIAEQLTRGRGSVDLSGRDQIFAYFFNFFSENLLLGNVGTKLWWNSAGFVWHSHNSYLEFLASNGLLTTLIFAFGMFFLFRKNIVITLPILIFSCFQYGFLWGLSFYDIIFSAVIYNYALKYNEMKGGFK
ncbi:MAG: hypothetical protein EON51_08390 [Acinetobacter sp.]|nr:MAG: hypothetical protein EON51_08390 [Acinetobacter sp.]